MEPAMAMLLRSPGTWQPDSKSFSATALDRSQRRCVQSRIKLFNER